MSVKIELNTESIDKIVRKFDPDDPDGSVKGLSSEKEQQDRQNAYLEQEAKRINNEQNSDTNKLRRELAAWSKKIIVYYLSIVMVLFVGNYCSTSVNWPVTMRIPNNVFMVVLGTTSANIIGLMVIILKGLFK